MEGHAKVVLVTMVLIGLAIWSGPTGANGQTICGMKIDGLKSCGPSASSAVANPPPPSAACCMALENADLQCLCFFKNSKWIKDNGIDFNRAASLPVQCKLAKSFHC